MRYSIEIRPVAVKDLRAIGTERSRQILERIRALEDDLAGDVKRLAHFDAGYRLRVGEYRVLFDVERDRVMAYR